MPVRPAAAVIRRTHSQHGNKAKGRYRLAVAVRSFPRRQRAWPYGPSGRTHAREFPFPGAFFQMARHARPLRHVGLPPEGSPGSLRPIGNARPSAWRAFFVACGLPEGPDCVERILEAHATVPARLMEPRNVLPKLRHSTCLPDREISGQETCRVTSCRPASRLSGPKPPPDDKPAPKAPCALPEAAIVQSTGYAPTGSSGRQEASSPNNAPPPAPHRVMQPCERPSPPASLPSGRRRASASRRVTTAWNQAISRHRLPFLHACPSARPYGPAGQPPDNDRQTTTGTAGPT